MANPADLATLRLCERAECDFAVINGITELKVILLAMGNHIRHLIVDSAKESNCVPTGEFAKLLL